MNEYLPLATLLRLLAVFALTLAPHAMQLPVWESLFIAALVLWRGLAAYRQWRMPHTVIKMVLTALAFAGVIASFGRILGQTGGTALLCVMGALKLLEFKGRRDVMVMVFLMYFVLVTHFLVSQEIWTMLYLLGCVLAVTAILIECQHRGALTPRTTLRKSGGMVLQALPLMLALFVLFPRIPGPLWGLPADAGAARSGLSDSMSPGDISKLIESDEVSFRVSFNGPPPPPATRYWRGPVFDRFDGRTWTQTWPARRAPQTTQIDLRGTPTRYTITLEAQRSRWLFALDLPDAQTLPRDAYIGAEGELLSDKPVTERRRYTLTSHTDFALDTDADERELARNLRLPRGIDPQARALAESWKQQGLDDEQIVAAALNRFHDQAYIYTLRPPALGRDSIDEFLFETRRGFCEHYAGAFTFLMRAAGIPARVVTGYQGGARNEFGDYYVVRQSDAHAWSEVWLKPRGWVRVDPTAVIAPSRVESDLADVLNANAGLRGGLDWRTRTTYYLEARWEWLNGRWNGMVLAYGPELQQEFLSRFGIRDYQGMVLALTVATTLLMSIVGLLLLRQFAPARSRDPALRAWQRMCARLARAGYPQGAHEGPQDFAHRVAIARPDWAQDLQRITQLYLQSRYLQAPDRDREVGLRNAVRRFRPSR